MTEWSTTPVRVMPGAGDTPRHRPGVGLMALAIVALAAGLAGAAIDRYVIVKRLGPLTPLVLGTGPSSPADAHRLAARVARELDLSSDQETRVDTIIAHRMADARVMRTQVRAQLLAMIDSAQTEIDSVLTPAQQKKFLELRRRRGYVDAAGHPIMIAPRP